MTIHCRINDGFKRVLIYLLHKYSSSQIGLPWVVEILSGAVSSKGSPYCGKMRGAQRSLSEVHLSSYNRHLHTRNQLLTFPCKVVLHIILIFCFFIYSNWKWFHCMTSQYRIDFLIIKKTKNKKHGVLFDYRLMMLHLYFISILTF